MGQNGTIIYCICSAWIFLLCNGTVLILNIAWCITCGDRRVHVCAYTHIHNTHISHSPTVIYTDTSHSTYILMHSHALAVSTKIAAYLSLLVLGTWWYQEPGNYIPASLVSSSSDYMGEVNEDLLTLSGPIRSSWGLKHVLPCCGANVAESKMFLNSPLLEPNL